MHEQTEDVGSLSGDPLVAVAREWAERRKPGDLCRELFVRVIQLSLALSWVCRQSGVDMQTALEGGIEMARETTEGGVM